MPVDWHGVRHTVVTYSNVDEMALLERMLQGSRELSHFHMPSIKLEFPMSSVYRVAGLG